MNKQRPYRNSAKYEKLITFVSGCTGYDLRYVIDTTKIMAEFCWNSDENVDSGIVKTVEWYLKTGVIHESSCSLCILGTERERA